MEKSNNQRLNSIYDIRLWIYVLIVVIIQAYRLYVQATNSGLNDWLSRLNLPSILLPSRLLWSIWFILTLCVAYATYRAVSRANHPAVRQLINVAFVLIILHILLITIMFYVHQNPSAALAMGLIGLLATAYEISLVHKIDQVAAGLLFIYFIWLLYILYINYQIVQLNP